MRVNERMKKVFSILLCLCMVLQYVPFTAFAAETVCTCDSDDPALHAPFCDLYTAPEDPVCTCAEACTAASVNERCAVCYFEADKCTGTDRAAAYGGHAMMNSGNPVVEGAFILSSADEDMNTIYQILTMPVP